MKNDRYKSIFEQAEQAQNAKEQRNCLLTIVKIMAENHLPCIEKKVGKIYWVMFALAVMVFFSDQVSLTHVILFFMRLFG